MQPIQQCVFVTAGSTSYEPLLQVLEGVPKHDRAYKATPNHCSVAMRGYTARQLGPPPITRALRHKSRGTARGVRTKRHHSHVRIVYGYSCGRQFGCGMQWHMRTRGCKVARSAPPLCRNPPCCTPLAVHAAGSACTHCSSTHVRCARAAAVGVARRGGGNPACC